jgi:hypothetical protein
VTSLNREGLGELTAVLPSKLRLRWVIICGLVALAIIAYVPAQLLPLIADDYVQINLGRRYGPMSAWLDLAADALYRCRATSLVLTYWTEKLFGFSPAAFTISSVLVHVVNVLLVALLGLWRPIGWRVSVVAAAFFAIAEGHQEAVIWYAALPELLVFTFVVSAFIAWVLWIQSLSSGIRYYLAALLLFVLALLSKESAVCLVGLQAIAILANDPRKRSHWIGVIPFVVLSIVYFASAYVAKSTHLHFNDGTFSLSAPFYVTLGNSIGRMFWIWGVIGLAAGTVLRRVSPRFVIVTLLWAAVTLLPYTFLTYMPRVPSRHTYLASVALAWLVAAGFLAVRSRWRTHRQVAAAFALIVVAHNCGYLWTKKQRQFADRAAPTRDLIEFSRKNTGQIYVKCFPYGREVAELALLIEGNDSPTRLRWADPSECTGHRFETVPLESAAKVESVTRSAP